MTNCPRGGRYWESRGKPCTVEESVRKKMEARLNAIAGDEEREKEENTKR